MDIVDIFGNSLIGVFCVLKDSFITNRTKKKGNAMKARIRKLMSKKSMPVFALALLACVLLRTGIVWAKSTEYSVNCSFTYSGTYIARDWTDDDGVRHLRGITYWLSSDTGSGNIEIDIAGVCNHNIDTINGVGDFWGKDHEVLVTWNGLTGTFQGSHSGIRTDYTVGSSSHIFQGIDGDFVGWTLRLNGTWNMHPDVKAGSLEGILHNPHSE